MGLLETGLAITVWATIVIVFREAFAKFDVALRSIRRGFVEEDYIVAQRRQLLWAGRLMLALGLAITAVALVMRVAPR
jgi:hypothetical protein